MSFARLARRRGQTFVPDGMIKRAKDERAKEMKSQSKKSRFGVPIAYVCTSNGPVKIYDVNGVECYSLTELRRVAMGLTDDSKVYKTISSKVNSGSYKKFSEETRKFIVAVPSGSSGTKSLAYVPVASILDFANTLHHGVLKTWLLSQCGVAQTPTLNDADAKVSLVKEEKPVEKSLPLIDSVRENANGADKLESLERRIDSLTASFEKLAALIGGES